MAVCLLPAPASAQARNVVMLYSNSRLLPANIEADQGFRETIARSRNGPVEIFAEFLDRPSFSGPGFEKIFAAFVHDKYATRPPAMVVAVGYPALDFMLRHREELFARVPVVHIGVEEASLKLVQPLPTDVVGVPATYDFVGTIQLALRLHPGTRRLIVVTGTERNDRAWETQLRAELPRLGIAPAVEYLAGLPHDAVMRRLRELGAGDVVFTPGYFRDGAGRAFAPRDAAAELAAASAAPVYGPLSTMIGRGVVGGRMPDYAEMGREGARAINGLLAGTTPERLPLPAESALRVQLDWNQVRRWSIDPALVPPGATLHFKQPTFWEAYRTQVIGVVAVMVIQAALIAALLLERRRRRRTASALEESEDRMRLASRAAGLSVWAWDVARDKFWTSARFGQREGSGGGQPVRFEHVLAIVHPADRESFNLAVQRASAGGGELDVEYRVIQPNGEARWFAARGRGARNESGTRLTGIALDITARKLAELQAAKDRTALTHLTRVSTLGQLSASIAHQLNQPLAAILGNAEVASKMLGQPHPDLAELQEICDDIVKEDNRAAEVIRRLSALYKRGETKFAPLNLNELVTETLELVRTELMTRHVLVVTELSASLPLVDGERVQLQQVLLNLILNAADAMGEVEAGQRRLTVITDAHGASVRLQVIDNGAGIAPQSLDAVFDPFWSTKAGGTGVGLTICQSIVSAHRGTLTAANNPRGGARLCATWPIRHDERPR